MTLVYVALFIFTIVLAVLIWLLSKSTGQGHGKDLDDLRFKIENLPAEISRVEASVKNEIANNRREASDNARNAREEIAGSVKSFAELITSSMGHSANLQKEQLESFALNLNGLTKSIEEKL